MIHIREARTTDIEGIADVAKDVWEQHILRGVCEAQVEDGSSALWVAASAVDSRHPAAERRPEEVIGFISTFLTLDASDRRRWEIDLVAVRQGSQGRGLGTRLIRQACELGESNEVSLTRALVRVENIASQRAFEKAGFTSDGQVHRLVLWNPRRGDSVSPGESRLKRSVPTYGGNVVLLPVDTLMYRGLWIEGLTSVSAEEQRLVVKTARASIAREHRDNTGALIPVREESYLATDLREEGGVHGEYTWFIRSGS